MANLAACGWSARILLAAVLSLGPAGTWAEENAPRENAPSAPDQGIAADLQRAKERERAHRAAAADAKARAAAQAAEVARLVTSREAAAARLREAEETSAAAIAQRDAVRARARRAETDREAAAAALARLLPLAVRLSLYPTETLLAAPVPPEDAVRDVQVVQGLAHDIAAAAATLQRETAAAKKASAEAEDAARQAEDDVAAQTALAAALDQRFAEAQNAARAEAEAASAAERAAAEDAAHEASLGAALARLAADRAAAQKEARAAAARARRHDDAAAKAAAARDAALAAPSGPGLAAAHGALMAPVAGAVVARFGDAGEAGPAQGLSFRPPPGARVVSPCVGQAAFAGPFRSYGIIVIIDCGEGYDFVLAGLGHLSAVVGEKLRPGDAVGEMSHDDGSPHLLYVELRHHGAAIDPAPWFAGRR